ncbi:MAG TPA: hypothetical protein VLI92_01805 [Candidatus Saccharimonadales bacterium]|nr:hypothetical protein [Candidatus Saccharimonadales bacterium]
MLKKILDVYKIPLLISLTLGVVFIALKIERQPLTIAFIILGTLLGTFFIDLDYYIYAYFLEPNADFSKSLRAFISHKDFLNTIAFIQYHKNDIQDKILSSLLFQIVLAGAAIFVTASTTGIFIKALVLSTFVNSVYRLNEETMQNSHESWFWALKSKPSKTAVYIYEFFLVLIFLYCLFIF